MILNLDGQPLQLIRTFGLLSYFFIFASAVC